MIDEKDIMLKVKAGELGYLAELFENNRVGLFNFFLRMGINRALSEDLVQETFMRVLAYRTSFKAQSSFKAWLYRIARNAVADHFRKLGNQDIYEEYAEDKVTEPHTLTDQLERESQHTLFEKALAALPAEQREIIVLSRFQQFNYEEIAELLNINLNTLKTRMRTAIEKLKAHYNRLSGETTL